MRTANPKIMLERLIEKWTDPDDATINEELEFEKQLWMRTALHACVQMVMTGEDARSEKSASNSVLVLSDVVKILSLYEDHGMCFPHIHGFMQSLQVVNKGISIPKRR
jgi:hypothetical protein